MSKLKKIYQDLGEEGYIALMEENGLSAETAMEALLFSVGIYGGDLINVDEPELSDAEIEAILNG